MKKLSLPLFVLLVLAFVSPPSSAGLTYPNRVSVSDYSMSGGVRAAFQAPNAVEAIQCVVDAYGTGVSGSCMATDAAGTMRSCSTSNAAMLDNMRMVGPASYISVGISAGTCTYVRVYNGSQEM